MASGVVRFEDWPLRLQAFLDSRMSAPFRWGTNDCGLFAADAVLAMTGTDPAEELRGRYCTARGAYALCGAMKWPGIATGIAERIGAPEIATTLARRGDVVLMDVAARQFLAVCAGRFGFSAGPQGTRAVSMDRATRAWAIG